MPPHQALRRRGTRCLYRSGARAARLIRGSVRASKATTLLDHQKFRELAPVGGRGKARLPLEQAAEEGDILVSNLSSDLVDVAVGTFDRLLGLLDAQGVHIVLRQIAGRRSKASGKGARREAGELGHGGDWV